jgi:hypothetical protein
VALIGQCNIPHNLPYLNSKYPSQLPTTQQNTLNNPKTKTKPKHKQKVVAQTKPATTQTTKNTHPNQNISSKSKDPNGKDPTTYTKYFQLFNFSLNRCTAPVNIIQLFFWPVQIGDFQEFVLKAIFSESFIALVLAN